MCATAIPGQADVEHWINHRAAVWLNDTPRNTFQRRSLALAETTHRDGDVIGVVAWQDITNIDLEGIWLEVVAIRVDHQHRGTGQAILDLTIEHLRTIDRDGDHIAGLVHPNNTPCRQLLTSAGWTNITTLSGHELWATKLR